MVVLFLIMLVVGVLECPHTTVVKTALININLEGEDNMRLAVIEHGIVTNVVEGDFQSTRHIFPLESQVVNVDLFPVAIGDSYQDGKFYRNGEVVSRTLTADERIAQLEVEKEALLKRVDELTLAFLEKEAAVNV